MTFTIYKRHTVGKRLEELDVRIIAGRVFVTKASLAKVLSGKPEMPI